MLGPDKAKELAQSALTSSKADQTEIILRSVDSSLTRFANNAIHQNVAESDSTVRVRVALGKRVGVAELNDLSADGIRRAVETARAIAQLQPVNPDFKGLPPPQPIQPVESFVARTADFSPEARAKVVAAICRQAASNRLSAAGAFKTESYELAVANSLGTFAYHPGTLADLHAVMSADSGTGFASAASPDVRDLNGDAVGGEAMDKALRARNPLALQPGEYAVLLEPAAVADVLRFLGFYSFNALAVQEDRSFMKDHFGEKVMHESVSITDDGHSAETFSVPFDYEGVPKQRVTLIENGIARGVTFDSYTAGKAGGDAQSTGHSLPAPNTRGPIPMHLFLSPGSSSRDEIIRSITLGVLVTRFWYTRVVHPRQVMMTGMTRDGTFLIEQGEITQPIKSMRFTTSYLEVLKNAVQIGRETKLFHEEWVGQSQRVPALLTEDFNFTGVTQ